MKIIRKPRPQAGRLNPNLACLRASLRRYYSDTHRGTPAGWARHVGYAGPSDVARWATREAMERAWHLAESENDPVGGLSSTPRMALAGIQAYGHGFRIEASVAEAFGVRLAAPFLDPSVVAAFLAVPAHVRTSPDAAKPLLATALRDVLPVEVRLRRSKGDYSALVYRGIAGNIGELVPTLRNSQLEARGLLDAERAIMAVHAAAAGLPAPIGAIAKVFAAEVWLRTRPRPVTWLEMPVAAPHATRGSEGR